MVQFHLLFAVRLSRYRGFGNVIEVRRGALHLWSSNPSYLHCLTAGINLSIPYFEGLLRAIKRLRHIFRPDANEGLLSKIHMLAESLVYLQFACRQTGPVETGPIRLSFGLEEGNRSRIWSRCVVSERLLINIQNVRAPNRRR